jgi:hypothetical protein
MASLLTANASIWLRQIYGWRGDDSEVGIFPNICAHKAALHERLRLNANRFMEIRGGVKTLFVAKTHY